MLVDASRKTLAGAALKVGLCASAAIICGVTS